MSHPRSVLRNRKTGEEFADVHTQNLGHYKKLRNPGLFTARPQPSETAEFTVFLRYFEQYIADLKAKNPDLPKDKDGNTMLDAMAKDMPNQFHRFGDIKKTGLIIQELNQLNQKEKLNETDQQQKLALSAALQKIIFRNYNDTIVNDDSSTSGFLKHIGKTYVTAQLDSIFPGAGMITSFVLSQVMTSAAAQTACPSGNWVLNNGMPQGAQSACSGISGPYSTCKEGFLTCGTSPWQVGDSQYSVGAQLSGGYNTANAGASIALDHCFQASDVGNIVKDILANSTFQSTPITCSNQMPAWYGLQPQVSAILPPELCNEFYSSAASVVEKCESWNQQAIWNTIIAFSVIGGVAAIALGITAVVCCISSDRCRK